MLLELVLGPNRRTHCLIPQPDDPYKLCPQKRGNNRTACKGCPYRRQLEKEDRSILSLEQMWEDYHLEQESPFLMEDDVVLSMALDELNEELRQTNKRSYRTLRLILGGMKRSEIVTHLCATYGISPSTAYAVIKDVSRMIRETLRL